MVFFIHLFQKILNAKKVKILGVIKSHSKLLYKIISLRTVKLFYPINLKLITTDRLLLILITILLLFTACKDEITQPAQKPPGYQNDIPWPSLADSPWPMDYHDPQNTGRSQYPGPKIGMIDWVLDSLYIDCSIAIGKDSTIYLATGNGSISSKAPGLYAIKPNGEIKWVFNFPNQYIRSFSTPLIASDGTIYCSVNGPQKFYAINTDGTLKWFEDNINLKMNGINIGLDGTLYFIQSGGILTALSKNGEILWTYSEPNFYGGDFSSLTFSSDGKTLYLYTFTPNARMIAFDIENRNIKWGFGSDITGPPVVDNDGNLYLIANVDTLYNGDTAVYSLTKNGKIVWSYPINSAVAHLFYSNPIIDKLGNIYCGYDTLYSFDYSGNLRWKKDLCGSCQDPYGFIVAPIICDRDGIIYASITDYNNSALKRILAISSNGNVLWDLSLNLPLSPQYGFSPVIGYDNAIYYPTYRTLQFLKIK